MFPTLGLSSLPVVVAQPDEKHANRAASWSGMTDTEHSTTSSSNEEELLTPTKHKLCLYQIK